MNEADWRTIGYIGITLGAFFLIGCLIAYYFPENIYWLGYNIGTTYPYRDYSVGLLIAGVAIAVVGGGAWWRADMERQKNGQTAGSTVPYPQQSASAVLYSHRSAQSVPSKFCRFCGTENKADAVFCEKCGRQIVEPKSSPQIA